MKHMALVIASTLMIGGCFEAKEPDKGLAQATKNVETTEVSSNSPDVTVKSWWRVKDAGVVMYIEACKGYMRAEAPYLAKLAELSTPEIYNGRECPKIPDTYDRQITKVDVQSDTRAVVMARIRNTTPPDEGAALTEEEKSRKESGEAYQYVLERKDSSSDWKIAQVSNMPSWARDWQVVFKKPEPSTNRWVFEHQQ